MSEYNETPPGIPADRAASAQTPYRPEPTDARPRPRRIVLAIPFLLALAAVAFDLTGTMTDYGPGGSPAAGPARSSVAPGRCGASQAAAATPGPMASMTSTDAGWMGLSTFIGTQAGTRLAGNAPMYVSAEQVRVLGDAVPVGASVDACTNRITFAGGDVSFVVEAVPADNPDMTFRVAGLVDPTIVVNRGATVTVEFINADTDQAHGWVVTGGRPPFTFRPDAGPAFPGAAAAVIGDPVGGRQGARNITFDADTVGDFHYLCPMPGHAEMGMQGAFTVVP